MERTQSVSIPKQNRPTRNRRWYFWGIFFLLTACAKSCTAPCGEFEFHDLGVQDTSTQNGWNMDVDFDFSPSVCKIDCACNKVVYVQIVRSVNHDDGTYLYPSTEKEQRATSTGFYLDRLAEKIWGYYGRNDNGSFAGSITVGSDSTTATLRDFPKRPVDDPWLSFTWMAITVPVCIDNVSSSCNNQLLGYYEWAWIVNDEGTVTAAVHWVSPKGFKDDFDDAVAQWNIQAPGLGKNTFPAFTRLSE